MHKDASYWILYYWFRKKIHGNISKSHSDCCKICMIFILLMFFIYFSCNPFTFQVLETITFAYKKKQIWWDFFIICTKMFFIYFSYSPFSVSYDLKICLSSTRGHYICLQKKNKLDMVSLLFVPKCVLFIFLTVHFQFLTIWKSFFQVREAIIFVYKKERIGYGFSIICTKIFSFFFLQSIFSFLRPKNDSFKY